MIEQLVKIVGWTVLVSGGVLLTLGIAWAVVMYVIRWPIRMLFDHLKDCLILPQFFWWYMSRRMGVSKIENAQAFIRYSASGYREMDAAITKMRSTLQSMNTFPHKISDEGAETWQNVRGELGDHVTALYVTLSKTYKLYEQKDAVEQ